MPSHCRSRCIYLRNGAFTFARYAADCRPFLESANVVGYANNAIPKEYSMITPCFEIAGGGSYVIDSLTLEGVEDTQASVQIVNADGS